jgi:hypothetical protein
MEKTVHQASDRNPAQASFQGEARHRIEFPGRVLELQSRLHVRSDESRFFVDFVRSIFENDRLVRTQTWSDVINREFQ